MSEKGQAERQPGGWESVQIQVNIPWAPPRSREDIHEDLAIMSEALVEVGKMKEGEKCPSMVYEEIEVFRHFTSKAVKLVATREWTQVGTKASDLFHLQQQDGRITVPEGTYDPNLIAIVEMMAKKAELQNFLKNGLPPEEEQIREAADSQQFRRTA